MKKKMIEIERCCECPNCHWYEYYKTYECNKKNNKMIFEIETIPPWCPLPDRPLTTNKSSQKPEKMTIQLPLIGLN